MPRSPKYPLETLLEHRERLADEKTAELAESVRRREQASAARARAEAELRAEEERAARVREGEARHLERGELRAVDLARQAAWETAEAKALAELAAAEQHAAERLDATVRDEHDARRELAEKRAERDVVAKDQARFVDRARRAREAGEEEAAEEVFCARRKER